MHDAEEKAKEVKRLLEKNTREQLADIVEKKTGAKISGSTITRAANNKDIKANMLHLLHYALTH